MQIPSSLGALLAKLGLAEPLKEGELGGKGLSKADAKALIAAVKEAAGKGLELGPDGELLTGLGYAESDKETPKKNLNEKSNVERFLKDTSVERAETENPFAGQLGEKGEAKEAAPKEVAPKEAAPKEAAPKEAAPNEKAEKPAEPTEKREVADKEMRRDEKVDEGRIQGQQEAEAKESTEMRESKEAEAQQQQRQKDEDEEDKPGAGWVAEELEEEEKNHKRGLRDADALGEAYRCKGHLEDGSLCLRKPMSGTPYCAEHAASWAIPPTKKA